jgi:NACalpha-BTF3-like transcription factor
MDNKTLLSQLIGMYPNSPMDPLANQRSILDDAINNTPMYDYSKSPEENAIIGSSLTMLNPTAPPPRTIFPEEVTTVIPVSQTEIPSITLPKVKSVAETSKQEFKQEQPKTVEEEKPVEPEQIEQPKEDTELSEAQRQRNNMLAALLITKAGNRLGSAIAKVSPDEKYLSDPEIKALAESPLADLLQRRKQAQEKTEFEAKQVLSNQQIEKNKQELDESKSANDPNSDLSKSFRDFVIKQGQIMGLSINPGEMSYSKLSKLYGPLTNLFAAKFGADERREAALVRAEEKAESKKQAQENKFDEVVMKINDRINAPNLASSRNALGKNMAISNGADRIRTLIKSETDPNKLTGRQVYEIAKTLDAMLALGAPTISGTDKLMPKTLMSQLMASQEYLSNKPVGAKMGLFVKQMEHLVDREQSVAKDQIAKFQKMYVAGIPQRILDERKSDIDKIMRAQAEASATEQNIDTFYGPAEEAAIKLVMQKNNISRTEAIKALKDAGKL